MFRAFLRIVAGKRENLSAYEAGTPGIVFALANRCDLVDSEEHCAGLFVDEEKDPVLHFLHRSPKNCGRSARNIYFFSHELL